MSLMQAFFGSDDCEFESDITNLKWVNGVDITRTTTTDAGGAGSYTESYRLDKAEDGSWDLRCVTTASDSDGANVDVLANYTDLNKALDGLEALSDAKIWNSGNWLTRAFKGISIDHHTAQMNNARLMLSSQHVGPAFDQPRAKVS
jgi:hypothetical protein